MDHTRAQGIASHHIQGQLELGSKEKRMTNVTPACAPSGTFLAKRTRTFLTKRFTTREIITYQLNSHDIPFLIGYNLERSPTRSRWNRVIGIGTRGGWQLERINAHRVSEDYIKAVLGENAS